MKNIIRPKYTNELRLSGKSSFVLLINIFIILYIFLFVSVPSYTETLPVNTSTTVITTGSGSTLFGGNQAVVIDPELTVTGDNIDGARVMIGNVQSGDQISCQMELPSGVGGLWDNATGIFTFSGTASAQNYQTLLRSISFNTTSSVTDQRNIVFSLGSAVPYGGHFYEYVNSAVSWSEAYTNAAQRKYFGMVGYLATITSASENELIRQKLQADAWIGASDNYNYINSAKAGTGFSPYTSQSQTEGCWYWVTGPEAGILFSVNNTNPILQPNRYMNWTEKEPNNSNSNENCGEIYSSGSSGKWNDLSGTSPLGYVVEYGGMTGDPDVRVSANKNIIIASHTAVVSSAAYSPVTLSSITGAIYNVPIGTSKASFLAALTKGQADQTWNTSAISDPVATGNQLIVTAQDGYTKMTYIVRVNQVYLESNSLGIAGDTKITGLISGQRYQVRTDGSFMYVRANGTLSSSEMDVGFLTGTEITGLLNQTTYKVEQYTPTMVNVRYDAVNGSPLQTIHADFNTTLTAPATPAKVGYTFDGWYRESTYATPWNFGTDRITSDITLYAKWTLNRYTLTYTAGPNGSIAGTASQTVYHGYSGAQVEAVPVTGYHFVKWSDNLVTARRTDSNITGNISVTAYFAANQYTVTFDTLGGPLMNQILADYGSLINMPSPPVEGHYTFAGWYKDSVLLNPWNFTTDHVTGYTILYAKWINLSPSGTIKINADNASTNNRAVVLNLSATDPEGDDIISMCFSDDGTVWSGWENFKNEKNYVLSSGDGAKTVYVKFMDLNGNESIAANDAIALDTTPPLVSGIEDNGAYKADVSPVFTDGTAALFRDDIPYPFESGQVLSSEGKYRLVLTDSLGNVNTIRFSIDKTAPSGTLSINNGNEYTTSAGVSLKIAGSDGTGTGFIQMRFSNDNLVWSPWSTTSASAEWTIGGGYGLKTVFMQLRDRAGNTSENITDTILYKSIPESGNSTVSGSEDSSVTFSASDFVYNNGDGSPLDKVIILSLPGHGALKLDNAPVTVSQEIEQPNLDKLVYTPESNWNGNAYLDWKGSSGEIGSAQPARINIVIAPVNDAPVAFNGSLTTNVDEPGYGTLHAADPDGDTLTFKIVDQGDLGTVILNTTTGAYSYVPNTTGAFGSDHFIFTVSDGQADSNTATISVNIIASEISDLLSLLINAGSLTPEFSANTMDYTVSVESSTNSVTITPVASDSAATIKVNGNNLVEGSREIGLSAGGNTIVIEVTAQDGITQKVYTITVNRAQNPDTPEEPPVEPPEEPPVQEPSPDTSENPPVNISTDEETTGKVGEKEIVVGTTVITNIDGKTTANFTANEENITAGLEKTNGSSTVLSIPFSSSADVLSGELSGSLVKSMEQKEAVVEIKTEAATYSLPARQINIDSVAQQLGKNVELKNIKVNIQLSKPSVGTMGTVENASKAGKYSIVVSPLDFNVRCTYSEKTVEVSSFNSYVERMIAIPQNTDVQKITTAVVVEPDGTTRHVPTKVTIVNGKYYAKINSLTNSTYTVIWHPVEFKDLDGHRAKEAINDMGSRLIVEGTDRGYFNPESGLTREEFVQITIKALGLKPADEDNPFTDVEITDKLHGYINMAYKYGLIEGYGNGKFGPRDMITRGQAMMILERAMKITGLKVETSDVEIEKLIASYKGKVPDSSRNCVAKCIKAGIISGTYEITGDIEGKATRAEAVVMIRQLLKKSDMI